MRFLSLVASTLACCLLAGCSGSGAIHVTGKVILSDQTPVQGATVNFEDPEHHLSASGITEADGSFKLTTDKPGDGAPPGTYKVTVHPASPADSSQLQAPPVFHPRYQNPDSSQLQFTVDRKQTNFNIVLDKP